MALIVQKFGGTSVANTERIFNVADIVTRTAAAGNQVVVVVSAQGDTTDDFIEKAAEITDKPPARADGRAAQRRRTDLDGAARDGD